MISLVKGFSSLLFLCFFISSHLNQDLSLQHFPIHSDPSTSKAISCCYFDQTANSCSYTVTIKTSCSSPSYTRDKVSLAYGDSYGNEVYAQRLDNPSSRIFERCSTDTFQIRGPCTYEICYVYLLRVGSDGWKPEFVKVAGQNYRAVTFKYNTFVPNGVWFGFNHCNNAVSLSTS